MTQPIERNASSRRAALAKARQSRRPSRLGTAAGAAAKPDYLVPDDAGFPDLLGRTWQRASAAPDLATAVDVLLTLDGHVPAGIQLRALRMADECALHALFGRTWRQDGAWSDDGATPPGATLSGTAPSANKAPPETAPPEDRAFTGEIGLTTRGRVVLRVPSRAPLTGEEDLVGGVLRVPWPATALRGYQAALARLSTRSRDAAAGCRRWLAAAGPDGRHDILETLKEAALRTAPFMLYQEDRQYTNFRDRNTLTGKTLWPGHPDCALSSLATVPLDLWSDGDAVMVACLTLLVRSAGFARIEEANGTQLTLDHVAGLLEQTRLKYNDAPGGQPVPAAPAITVAALDDLAAALARRRRAITANPAAAATADAAASTSAAGTRVVAGQVRLYREIHGPLMHKIERVAGPAGAAARERETDMCARLRERLPVAGASLAELGEHLTASPAWLARPRGEFATGLESLVYETVRAATTVFDCDFAMSRGTRSLTTLIDALRAEKWGEIVGWDLPYFYCCVVPAPRARQYFADSAARLADVSWAISSRMQYNSWHFIAGGLPKVPEVAARDYFVPPTMPDVSFYSDQHHHGHVAAKVRFSIRSPQSVEVLGRRFDGFVDLRVLRCEGTPFGEQDVLAAHRTSAFIATATGAAAAMAADGTDTDITSFDSQWHWAKIASWPDEPLPGGSSPDRSSPGGSSPGGSSPHRGG